MIVLGVIKGWGGQNLCRNSAEPRCIQRALEVYELTGTPMTELFQRSAETPPALRFLKIVLAPEDRAVLQQSPTLSARSPRSLSRMAPSG